jgi:Kae1-associated kinase Bud32
MQKTNIIAQGAEAVLIRQGKFLEKKRIKKGYRHNELDIFLRTSRTRHESKILEKAKNLINVPEVQKTTDFSVNMDFVPGKKLSTYLDTFPEKVAFKICRQIGQQAAILHKSNIIHGDLTTSNMILNKGKVYFIDFGLSFHSTRAEDKAVDMHLIKEAIKSKHFKRAQGYFKNIINGYKLNNPEANVVLKQLEKVEARGRYKGKK